jgi:hypothetical protein
MPAGCNGVSLVCDGKKFPSLSQGIAGN